LRIQIGLSHEINLARSFVSALSTGHVALNFPDWTSHDEPLRKSISVGFSVFCRNGEVTACHQEKSFTDSAILNQFCWLFRSILRRCALLVPRRLTQRQFCSIVLLIIIHYQSFVAVAIWRIFFPDFDDSKGKDETGSATWKLRIIRCILAKSPDPARIEAAGRQAELSSLRIEKSLYRKRRIVD
jgi:hypothetical protein